MRIVSPLCLASVIGTPWEVIVALVNYWSIAKASTIICCIWYEEDPIVCGALTHVLGLLGEGKVIIPPCLYLMWNMCYYQSPPIHIDQSDKKLVLS